MSRRFGLGGIAVLGLGLSLWLLALATLGPPRGATATELLGIDLPASTGEERLAIQRHGFGEYRAYLRFAVDPADVPALLADPAFQPQKQADDPFAVFRNAAIGDKLLAAEVIAAPPAWWRPEGGARFTLVYRSQPGPVPGYHGPDAAWYIVDTSDPAQAAIHVYVLEV
jgi:hypothetical protein